MAETTQEVAAPEEPTSKQIQDKLQKQDGFWKSYLDDPVPEETPKAEDEPKPDPKPDPATETVTAEDPEPEPKPEPETEPRKKTRKPKPESDPNEVAREIGATIARELRRPAEAPTAKEPTADPLAGIPDEFKKDKPVFEEMIRSDPGKYGSLSRQLADYATKEERYIAKWEQENPGVTFDGEDTVHNDFYRGIQPKFDRHDFERAKEELIERRTEERVMARVNPVIERYEASQKAERLQPVIASETLGLVQAAIEEIAPEHKDLGKDWKTVAQLEEHSPMAADVITEVVQQVQPVLTAALRLFQGIDKFNRTNPAHEYIATRIDSAEKEITRMPSADRHDQEGRMFATQAEYVRMNAEEKARHWYIDEHHMSAILQGDARKLSKAKFETLQKRFAKWSGTNGKPAATAKPTAAAPARESSGSPTVTGRSTLPGDAGNKGEKAKTGRDLFFDSLLGA